MMLASFRSGGFDMNDEVDDDDGSASMIQDLLMQGAKINMTTDRTGRIFIILKSFCKNLT